MDGDRPGGTGADPRDLAPRSDLTWTGERFVPGAGGAPILYEHAHRYTYARRLVDDRVVVDLASGEGYGAALLAGRARSVVGVDVSAEAVTHAARTYGFAGGPVFVRGDIAAAPLADACCDVVTCFEAIEHVADPEAVLREARRILRPTGFLVVSTPDKAVYTDARDSENAFHVHELYVDELTAALDEVFSWTVLLGQRLQWGSAIWPVDGAGAPHPDVEGVPELGTHPRPTGTWTTPRPMYLIAVSGPGSAPPADLVLPASLMVDAGDRPVAELDDLAAALRWHEDEIASLAQVRQRLEHDVSARQEALEAALRERDELRERVTAHEQVQHELIERERAATRELDALRDTKLFRAAAPFRRWYGRWRGSA